jgi:predicted nucleic acid-binding Zn ribbon protein
MASRKCLICSDSFSGRRDAKTCSARCRKRLQKVKWSFMSAPAKRQLAKTLILLFVGVFSILGISISQSAKPATAATSNYLNFQSRLLTSGGAVVADGNYNIEFKITNDISSADGGTGACSGSCLWRETRQNSNSQGVRVVNGYLSVNLGSVTSFPAINWDQQLYLTMNIAGTGVGASPTYDGEMSPRITLTALPYAFRAGTLAKTDGSGNVGTLSFNTTANTPVITLPDATGTVCLQTSASCGFLSSTTGVQLQGSTPGSPQTGHFNISGTLPEPAC